MLDSQPRLTTRPPVSQPAWGARDDWSQDWEEATFTRPMRSPFADDGPRSPRRAPRCPEVEIPLEEAALFEPTPTREQMLPPPPRPSRLPPPRFDEEATARQDVAPSLLRALRGELDSVRLMQAAARAVDSAIDLSKTAEQPTVCDDDV